jgi:hypothetical protein
MSTPFRTIPLDKPWLKQLEEKLADLQHDPNFLIYAFATSFVALLISIC